MELECELSNIKNEELLRKMWQQSEDVNRKKEIRTHLYKLRESRLRDLYQNDIMADNAGFGKDPLTSHGDSLVDQSFQSLKSKEIRDSMSPTHDMKFHSLTLNQPNSTGWDVQTSSEVSPDGRAYRTETLASTDGVEKLNGGIAEFKGRNEQRSSASHQGDDKNFVKKAAESAKTHLQEKVVIGDENSGRTEMKMSSTSTSSSSQVISSSSNVEYDGAPTYVKPALMDKPSRYEACDDHDDYQRQVEQRLLSQHQQQRQQDQYHQHQEQQTQQHSEEYNSTREERNTTKNVETQQTREQTKRYVDMDKASPEYQKHVEYLMQQQGEIISNTVEYPKPNVKMITTVKRLPDGTIVKNKRYETEEVRPSVDSTTSKNQRQTRDERTDYQQTQRNTKNTQDSSTYTERTARDAVDNAEQVRYVQPEKQVVRKQPAEEVSTTFSSVQKSSRKFSTETTSETVEEYNDRYDSKPQTHGFPSVKPNAPTSEYVGERPHGQPGYHSVKPDHEQPGERPHHGQGSPSGKPNTQHHPSERPHGARPTQDFSTHGFPSVKPHKPTQEFPTDYPHSMQEVPTTVRQTAGPDGEVVIVKSSETKQTVKHKSNSERIIETEVITGDDYNRPAAGLPSWERPVERGSHPRENYTVSSPRTPKPRDDYSTHGFPSARSPTRGSPRSSQPREEYTVSSPRASQPREDFSTHGFPSARSPTREHPGSPRASQPRQDFSTHGFPSARSPTREHPSSPSQPREDYPRTPTHREEFTAHNVKHQSNSEQIAETKVITGDDQGSRPAAGLPSWERPIERGSQPRRDFTTHGFPSARSPTREHPSKPHGYPSARSPTRSQPDYSTSGFPSAREPTKSQPNYAKPTQSSPQHRPQQPSSATTTKKSTVIDSTKTLLHKERETDSAHRAFAASLRSSSPVDSYHDSQRHTPRSSVSSTRTFRRDAREGSHDSAVPSETSRISSHTVTRQSPSKSVGKTVVTKQTVKTKTVNGSNETIDLTPQRSTKSPSPAKSVTTTTTKTTTTTRKSPTSPTSEVPKSDNPITQPAETLFPINHEPLTNQAITKTHFSANDASFPLNEVVEEPLIKKHFYNCGPSDKLKPVPAERSPHSPALGSHKKRTHPQNQTPEAYEEPSSSSDNERHASPTKSPVVHTRNVRPTSVERRTVVSETTTSYPEHATDEESEPTIINEEEILITITDEQDNYDKSIKKSTNTVPARRGPINETPNTTKNVTKTHVTTIEEPFGNKPNQKNTNPQKNNVAKTLQTLNEGPRKPFSTTVTTKITKNDNTTKKHFKTTEEYKITDERDDDEHMGTKPIQKSPSPKRSSIIVSTKTSNDEPGYKSPGPRRPSNSTVTKNTTEHDNIKPKQVITTEEYEITDEYDDQEPVQKSPQIPKVTITKKITDEKIRDEYEHPKSRETPNKFSRPKIDDAPDTKFKPTQQKPVDKNTGRPKTGASPNRSSPNKIDDVSKPEAQKPGENDFDFPQLRVSPITSRINDDDVKPKPYTLSTRDDELFTETTSRTSAKKTNITEEFIIRESPKPIYTPMTSSQPEFSKPSSQELGDTDSENPKTTKKASVHDEIKPKPQIPGDRHPEYPKTSRPLETKPYTEYNMDDELFTMTTTKTKTDINEKFIINEHKKPTEDYRYPNTRDYRPSQPTNDDGSVPKTEKPTVGVPKHADRPEGREAPIPVTQKPTGKNSEYPKIPGKPKDDDGPEHHTETIKVNDTTQRTNNTKADINEVFITNEQHKPKPDELTDGAFISKVVEQEEPTIPTYRKKGLSRRETFEERCRHILGMENDGDTQGTFKKLGDTESEPEDGEELLPIKPTLTESTTVKVTVEDCEDDDQPLYISDLKKDTRFKSDLTEQTAVIEISDQKQRKPATQPGPKEEPIIKRPNRSDIIEDVTEVKETKVTAKTSTKKPNEERDLEEVTVTFAFEIDDTHSTKRTTDDTTNTTDKKYYSRPETDLDTQRPLKNSQETKQPNSETVKTSPQQEEEQPDSSDVTEFETSDQEFISSTTETKYMSQKFIKANDEYTIEEVKRSPSLDTKRPIHGSSSPVGSRRSPNKPEEVRRSLSPDTKRPIHGSSSPVGSRRSPNKSEEVRRSPLPETERPIHGSSSPVGSPRSPNKPEEVRRSPSPDTKRLLHGSSSPVGSRRSPNKPSTPIQERRHSPSAVAGKVITSTDEETFATTLRSTVTKSDSSKKPEVLTTRRSPSPLENLTSSRQPTKPRDDDRRSPSPVGRWTSPSNPITIQQERRRSPSPVGKHTSPGKITNTLYKETNITTNLSAGPKGPDTSSPRTRNTTDVKPKLSDAHTSPARKHPTPQKLRDSDRKPKTTDKTPISKRPTSKSPVKSDSSDHEYISSATEENYVSQKSIRTSEELLTKERRRSPSPLQEHTSPRMSKTMQEEEITVTTKGGSVPKGPIYETKSSPTRKPSTGDVKQKPNDSSTKPKATDKISVTKRPSTSKFTEETSVERSTVKTSNTVNKTTTSTSTSPRKDTKPSITRKGTNEKITVDNSVSKRQPRKPSTESATSTIKDRLRSSPRKQTPKQDDVDANSSPDSSPTRHTERRRSSNISVHTEIIIEHASPTSPKSTKCPKSPLHVTEPKKQPQSPQKSSPKDIMDTSRISRRFNTVTERKESAPVQRVTRQETDAKMARSTSENIIKVKATKPTPKEPAMTTLSPKTDRRPNKCFTTKTINLSSTNKIINSEDIESVVIDIQQAKSSREPSPDKIVPTPVPLHFDTGKPRYPDTVQEPEDEPRKRPVVKNVPIFEEDSNEFLHCHISEISVVKASDHPDYNEEYLDNPTVEAPKSFEYTPHDKPIDDSLLSVHEKVSKFTHTAEEVKKPKASSPFTREYDQSPQLPQNDDCLLTVNQKVDKFLRTAESITKRPINVVREIERPDYDQLYDDIRHDECTLSVSQKVDKFISTAEKLAPHAPQKAPELVARVERRISRQSEPGYPGEESDDDTPFSENHTINLELKRQKDILSRPSIWDKNLENTDTMEEVITISPRKPKTLRARGDDDEEPTAPTATTRTANIEVSRLKARYEHSPSPGPELAAEHPTNSNTHVDRTHRKLAPENLNKPNNEKLTHSPTNSLGKSTKRTKSRVAELTVKHTPTSNTPDHENITPIAEQTKRPKTSPMSSGRIATKNYGGNLIPEEINRPKSSSLSPERKGPINDDKNFEPIPATLEQTKSSPLVPGKSGPVKNSPDDANVSRHTQRPKTSTVPIGKSVHVTESVAARRNIFENGQPKKSTTPTLTGRRPSYMDHTRSSLEHTRRDSLEITKNNYSRKTSMEDDTQFVGRPNAAVKFDVPKKPRKEGTITEDINVEEIFELEILEELLEIVTSYELRRRIRAQIRLVKKNMHNTHLDTSGNITSSLQKSYTSTTHKVHHSATDTCSDVKQPKKPFERVYSPTRPHEETLTITDSKYRRTTPERSHSPDNHLKHSTKPVEHVYHPTRAQKPPHAETKKPTRVHEETLTIMDSKYSRMTPERSHSPDHYPKQSRKPVEIVYHPTRTQKQPHAGTKNPTERSSSPGSKTILKETRRTSGSSQTTSSKQHTYVEQVDHHGMTEVKSSPRPLRKQPSQTESTRSPSPPQKNQPKPLQRTHSPTYGRERSSSPELKPRHNTTRTTVVQTTNGVIKLPPEERSRSRSPQSKASSRQTETVTTTRTSYSTTTQSPERRTGKPKPDEKKPIWMDRKNVLRHPGSNTRSPTATSTSPIPSKVSASQTTKTTSHRQTKTAREEDSITSSYGIGPTDENGLPLFGIKALKKKKATQPCETTEEVTGYVVEEKYYADNKTKPTMERKEYIYSTNADELEELKHKKSLQDDGVIRKFEKIEKEFIHKPQAIMPDDEEFAASTSTRHYVRRGSVKEMSEKFIRKESSQSITEKSNGYPKAGLILLTNSRRTSTDAGDCFQPTQDVISHKPDSDHGEDYSYAMEHSSHLVTESESECESVKIQKEFTKKSSTSSTSTRSFLNSTGDSKVVTGVDDVLERMRNADNVVVEGDTPEDQEARALLNKFLGASVIMRGVETSLPPTKQTKVTTSFTNSDGDNLRKQEVKTTRVTKTIKSGSSSSPVTRTTCDIEEIWDEEILKELLEQAKTYEERRKIRARLRVLMADREEKKNLETSDKAEEEEEDSSASEYEEIIEEVTDYSEAEEEEEPPKVVAPQKDKADAKITKSVASTVEQKAEATKSTPVAVAKVTEETKKVETQVKATTKEVTAEVIAKTAQVTGDKLDKVDTVEPVSEQQGESLLPLLQDILHKNSPPKAKTAPSSQKPATNSAANTNTISESSSLTVNNKPTPNQDPQTTPTMTQDSKNVVSRNSGSSSSSNSAQPSTQQVHRLGVPQKEDSGTESGEDLRLIAAGLREGLHMQSDKNLIEEVTAALSRLESSLKEGKEITIEGGRRNALLALVARLQTGLTSPEKLAEVAENSAEVDSAGLNFDETSSPEADAHRSNKQRFAKRRNRNSRHTVGVSREELADARRYMEDMLMMENISSSTTPDSSVTPTNLKQTFPIEKNASMGAILSGNSQQPPTTLYRPNQFVPNNIKSSTECLNADSLAVQSVELRNKQTKRPLSGEYTVRFNPNSEASQQSQNQSQQQQSQYQSQQYSQGPNPANDAFNRNGSPDKGNRFNGKKQLMKRANTIDIPKTKKYNPDFDTDSEMEDKGSALGLKRAVQVNVKQKVRSVIPAFEPKTENDHKFLAFINKQTPKHGLGWNTGRSVSNWTNKFGNIKHSFEVGAAATVTTGKPPQAPGHVPQNAAKNYWNKHTAPAPQENSRHKSQQEAYEWKKSQQEAYERQKLQQEAYERQKSQQEAYERQKSQQEMYERQKLQQEAYERQKLQQEAYERQKSQQEAYERQKSQQEAYERKKIQQETYERQKKIDRERHERDRMERDRIERQRQEKDRMERDMREKAYYEQQRQEMERLAAEQHAQMPSMTLPAPSQAQSSAQPVNQFIHAPQSVFRPIDANNGPAQKIFKPIPQLPHRLNNWQPINSAHKSLPDIHNASSPNTLAPRSTGKLANAYITNPSPTTTSPIGLPWVAKPTPGNTDFRQKVHRLEERSQNDLRNERGTNNSAQLQRHNSLRSPKHNQYPEQEERKKRPSLPNVADPYMDLQGQFVSNNMYGVPNEPPPPVNISFSYADYKPQPPAKANYQSYPCLPTAVDESLYARSREDSLTNPDSQPLVLTSANPSFSHRTTPLEALRLYDYISPADSAPTSPSILAMPTMTDYTDDDLDSDMGLEYRAETRVMRKPQSQTAVTVGRRTNHMSDDEVFGKNSRAAKSLLHTMKGLGGVSGNNSAKKGNSVKNVSKKPAPPDSPICLSPDGRAYQAPLVEPLFPDVTNFSAKRDPLYAKETSSSGRNQQPPPPPIRQSQPKPQVDKAYKSHQQQLQLLYGKSKSNTFKAVHPPVPPSQPPYISETPYAAGSHSAVPPLTTKYAATADMGEAPIPRRPEAAPFVSETQPAYIVTYPIDDPYDSAGSTGYHRLPPTSLPLQRNRNLSENSTTSSTGLPYNNMPSPGSVSWTANPIHGTGVSNLKEREQKEPQQDFARAAPSQTQPLPYQQPPKTHPAKSTPYYQPPAIQTAPPIPPSYAAPETHNQPKLPAYPQSPNTSRPVQSYAVVEQQQIKPQLRPQPPQVQPQVQPQLPPQSLPPYAEHKPQVAPTLQPAHILAGIQQQQYKPQSQQQVRSQMQSLAHPQTPPPYAGAHIEPPMQPLQFYAAPPTQLQSQDMPPYTALQKPELAPKPQVPTRSQQAVQTSQTTIQPIQPPKPSQPRQPIQPTQPSQQTQSSAAPKQTQVPSSQALQPQAPKVLPKQQETLQQLKNADRPKLSTRSQTITSSSAIERQTKPQAPMLRQKTVDSGMTRDLQSSQQHYQSQQIVETRRKSLGHVLDVQEQQRKSSYFESENTIKQAYKSSAPENTPDIVKSSLPKDENVPILKKFGPPQRHLYIPNSYQSPQSNTTSKTYASNTQTVKTTAREVVQHSTHTVKPSIVEVPSTPESNEDFIPRNIVFNNVSAFTSMSRRQDDDRQTRSHRLSKSDSWNQIVQQQQAPKPSSPKFNTSGNELRRTKSGHSLAVPKMYEAGMDKEEISEKQKTVAAYFGGKKSPTSNEQEAVELRSTTTKRSTINRTKTVDKVSASRKSLTSMATSGNASGGVLMRSATMPQLASLNLLDESNVEDAFEQLMMGS